MIRFAAFTTIATFIAAVITVHLILNDDSYPDLPLKELLLTKVHNEWYVTKKIETRDNIKLEYDGHFTSIASEFLFVEFMPKINMKYDEMESIFSAGGSRFYYHPREILEICDMTIFDYFRKLNDRGDVKIVVELSKSDNHIKSILNWKLFTPEYFRGRNYVDFEANRWDPDIDDKYVPDVIFNTAYGYVNFNGQYHQIVEGWGNQSKEDVFWHFDSQYASNEQAYCFSEPWNCKIWHYWARYGQYNMLVTLNLDYGYFLDPKIPGNARTFQHVVERFDRHLGERLLRARREEYANAPWWRQLLMDFQGKTPAEVRQPPASH